MKKQLVGVAAFLVAVLGVLHALGCRDDVAILSGARVASVSGGLFYALFWFAAVVVAPAALLAAVGLEVASRFVATKGKTPRSPAEARALGATSSASPRG